MGLPVNDTRLWRIGGREGVVPVAVEVVAGDGEGGDLGSR